MKKIIYLAGIFFLCTLTQYTNAQALATLDYLTHSNCNNDPIGTIGITPFSSNYTFEWTGPNGFNSTLEDLDNLEAGIYFVTVTESGGQMSSDEFEILNLEGEETITIMACENDCDLWQHPVPCETGIYENVVTTNNGCDSIFHTEIIIIPTITIDIGTFTLCDIPCINVANNEYCEPGNYSAFLTSYSGCDSVILFSILENQADLIQSITPDTILCDPFEFQLEVIAPDAVAYEWFPSDNLSCFDCPNPVTMPFFSEFYTVIVTDANGCTDEASVFVEIPFGLDWSLFPWTNSPVCDGETLQFMSEVPVNVIAYEWEGPNGFSSTDPAPVIENITMAEAGIYSVTVTSVGGCTGVADFDVIVNENPIADAEIDMTVDCSTNFITLDGSGSSMGSNFVYTWAGPGIDAANMNVINPIVTEVGDYTLTVTDINTGCTSFDVVFVDDIIVNPLFISIETPDFCLETSFDFCPAVTGSSNFIYEWSFNTVIFANTACISFSNFSNANIGFYELIVTDSQTGCSAVQVFELIPPDCVWPGDTDTNKVVNNFDLLNIGLAFDATGPIRENASLNWEGQPAENWTELTPDGINYKHVDCDGNGIINADDTLAITQNWGLTHNLWAADDRDMGAPFYIERDTFVQDTTYAIPVILGEEDFPAEEVYGIAFTLVIDTSLVASDASINFENSWLGGINDDMIAIQKTTLHSQGGRIDAAVTRIDGQNMTGFGQMGTFFITIEDIIFQAPPGGEVFNVEKELIFKIENVKMIGFDGEIIAVNTDPQPSVSTTTTTAFLNSQIHVFPNPMSDILTIHSPNILMEKVEVFNIAGQSVIAIFEKNNQLILNTNNWQSGTYFIKIQTPEGIILKKTVK